MVTIGSLTLRDFEVPQVIHYGGQQRLAIHHLSDGRRIIEALGHDDAGVEFGGTLAGLDAADRARGLDGLCRTGTPVPLVWDTRRLTVIVQHFSADYRAETWIDYRLTCAVVDTTQPVPLATEAASRVAVTADAAAIGSLEPALRAAMNAISVAAVAAGAFDPGDPANARLRSLIEDATIMLPADLASRAIVLGYLSRMLASASDGGAA